MTNTRMSTTYMLKYCDEALECPEFGCIDKLFFESVKRIILGHCSAMDIRCTPDSELPDFDGPVAETDLESEYEK